MVASLNVATNTVCVCCVGIQICAGQHKLPTTHTHKHIHRLLLATMSLKFSRSLGAKQDPVLVPATHKFAVLVVFAACASVQLPLLLLLLLLLLLYFILFHFILLYFILARECALFCANALTLSMTSTPLKRTHLNSSSSAAAANSACTAPAAVAIYCRLSYIQCVCVCVCSPYFQCWVRSFVCVLMLLSALLAPNSATDSFICMTT